MANKLGRLDPETGIIKEYPLKTPYSGPHGLTYDKDGNIWFAANFAGYIGKFDPKAGITTEFKMPDPAARQPLVHAAERKHGWPACSKNRRYQACDHVHAEIAALRHGVFI